jgi:hypothetical protein
MGPLIIARRRPLRRQCPIIAPAGCAASLDGLVVAQDGSIPRSIMPWPRDSWYGSWADRPDHASGSDCGARFVRHVDARSVDGQVRKEKRVAALAGTGRADATGVLIERQVVAALGQVRQDAVFVTAGTTRTQPFSSARRRNAR